MKYLVLAATGRQGSAVVDALLAHKQVVVATTRNPESPGARALVDKGVTKVLRADFGDVDSLEAAIKESGASRVWFMTQMASGGLLQSSRAKEAAQGCNVIDAIKRCGSQVDYVVFSSVGDADTCPDAMQHFHSKADIEQYMAQELPPACRWAVIRPVCFLENLDDSRVNNPLTKGRVKFLTKPNIIVKFISIVDLGKGAATMLMDPDTFAGHKVDAAACANSGTQLAQILSEVSGTPCTYGQSLPRWAMWLFPPLWNLYAMTNFLENAADGGHTAEIAEFKKLVPDAMDARAWFASKGKWANGEKFSTAAR